MERKVIQPMNELQPLNDEKIARARDEANQLLQRVMATDSVSINVREVAANLAANLPKAGSLRESESAVPPDEIVESTKVSLRKILPHYDQSEFQCLNDLEKCKKYYGKTTVGCATLFILCVARQLIPFTGQKG
jgi:hypothetical protein